MSDEAVSSPPSSLGRRLELLRRMAWLCAVMVLVITSLSAFIRLSKAGLGCEPWPQCYGQELRAQQLGEASPEAGTATAVARLAHRVIASSALLLVLVMVMTALASRPALWGPGRMALGLLLLALFLAVLGRWTADARVPAVTLGNLLGGFAMFALSVSMALAAGKALAPGVRPSEAGLRLVRWAWLGAAALVLNVALGGMVSAGGAGLSCQQLAGCDLGAVSWQALDPWHEPSFDAAQPHNPAGAGVHLLHRAGALLVVAALLPLAVLAWRHGRRGVGVAILGLLFVQAGLGMALVVGSLPLGVALAHNVVAALMLALVLGLIATELRPASVLSPAL